MSGQQNIKALKSGIWYTAANFLVKSIGIITTPIFTRILTHAEFGLFNNFVSWLSILTIIVTLNLDSTFISARYDYEDKFDEYILSVLSLSSLSAIISALILNATFVYFQHSFGLSRYYLNCMLMYLLFLPAINMFQARERYYFRYKVSVALSLLVSISTALLSVLLVIYMSDSLQGRILGAIIPTIVVGFVIYLIIVKYGKKIKIEYWKYAIPICIPFIPHLLSLTVLNSVDRIMITDICGAEDNALYSLAYTCGSLITILVTSMNSAFAPWLGQKLHDKEYADIRGFTKKYVVFFLMLTLLIMLFTPEVLLILGGKSYMPAIYVMPPVACGCAFQFLYTLFVNVEQFSRKTVGMAIASISAALLNYILNLQFIPRFGYIAAAYTTLIGFLWLLIIHMILVKMYGLGTVYPYGFIVASVGVSLLITVTVNYLYQIPVLRYIIGGFYAAIVMTFLIKNRSVILSYFGKRVS